MPQKIKSPFEFFSFPDACIDMSPAETGILCVGTYKPVIKKFCLEKKSIVLDRLSDTDILRCEHVQSHKFITLKNNRTVDFYNKQGQIHSFKFNKDAYDISLMFKDIFVACKNSLHGINMENGSETEYNLDAFNIKFNKQNGFLFYNNEDYYGLFDIRSNSNIFKIDKNITNFDTSGYFFTTADKESLNEYDLRNVKNQINIIEGCFTNITYKNDNFKVFNDFSKIYFNVLDNNIPVDYKINCCCFSNDLLFVGGEKEEIDTFKI